MTEMNATEATEKKSLNFIEQAVENDLREGKNGGKNPLPARAERLPAHRSCQSHLSGFRDSCTLWWRM